MSLLSNSQFQKHEYLLPSMAGGSTRRKCSFIVPRINAWKFFPWRLFDRSVRMKRSQYDQLLILGREHCTTFSHGNPGCE